MRIHCKSPPSPLWRKRGAALPLVAAGMLALLAVAGLALDTSHALTNKTRLQNTADAAALAAAKVYDDTVDIFAGNAAALSLFGINADGAGNHELNDAYDANEISVLIQWSETLNPFVSTGLGPYVRVIATGYQLNTSLSAVLGVTEMDIAATAVAGPSPTINTACNIAPLVACGDPGAADLFGFKPGQVDVLKSASTCGGNPEIGPGNFQLIRLECGAGGDCVRENLAGDYNGCATKGETVETEPGNTVGPTVQGLNTRFGVYTGQMSPEDYHPDVIVTQPDSALTYECETESVMEGTAVADDTSISYGWDDYLTALKGDPVTTYDNPEPVGVHGRRVLAVPIADCSGINSGQSTLTVLGFGCFFMLQQVKQKGNEANIYGQFIEGCRASGLAGPNPVSGPEPYLIQLYKDPDSADS